MKSCIQEKKNFDECFSQWLKNGLLSGKFEKPCKIEWEIYEKCLNKELSEKNLLDLKSFSEFKNNDSSKTIENKDTRTNNCTN
ncbi:Mitochondrial distribution/morphology family 35/apoptosis [Cryptosporidium felis]|nr:Mitochondrial distribution/morphology family 35/apoptosis [Cryptosporidium felis]